MSLKTDDLASSDEIKIYSSLEDEEEPEHNRSLLQEEILKEVLDRFVSVCDRLFGCWFSYYPSLPIIPYS